MSTCSIEVEYNIQVQAYAALYWLTHEVSAWDLALAFISWMLAMPGICSLVVAKTGGECVALSSDIIN